MPSENENKQARKYYEDARGVYLKKDILESNLKSKLTFLQKNKYCIVDILNDAKVLENTFNLIEKEWNDPSPEIARLTQEGFSVYGGPSLKNVTYVSHFDDECLSDISNFLIKTGIKTLLQDFYNANIGVCNVRAYRYTHNPEQKNTHRADTFEPGMYEFNRHKDGLLPESIKIMIYHNPIGEDLTLSDGLTELNIPDNSSTWIAAEGLSPTCLIFSSNEILHKAERPKPDRVRDIIELTIIPKIEDDFPIISSGAHAGFPLNLRTHWSKPPKIKMPYKGITSFIDIVNSNPRENIKVMEIGVYEGVTAKLYAQTIKNCKGELWALDNFEGEDLAKRNPSFDNRTWLEKNPGNFHPKAPSDNNWNRDLLNRFEYNLRGYERILTIIKGETENTIKTLSDNYYDIIFIDAAHDYWSVLEDIGNCISKIKKGGILCGHDINDKIYDQFKKDGREASKIKEGLSHEKLCISKWGVALAVYEIFGSSAEVIGQGPDRIWVVCDEKFNSNWRN